MPIYIIAVILAVLVLTSVLAYVLRKRKLLDYRMLLAMAFGSLLAGIIFPAIYNLVLLRLKAQGDNEGFILTLVVTLFVYIILAFILSAAATFIIPEGKNGRTGSKTQDSFDGHAGTPQDPTDIESEGAKTMSETGNYLAEIYDSHVIDIKDTDEKVLESTENTENNLEKSVDSEKNIDKMGIEINEQDHAHMEALEQLSIDDCVEEAFRLKSSGDAEGAILYFMYALDRKPAKELVFWIILDICALYKESGQVELARDILSNYSDNYGDIMDASIKAEIESSLASY